MARKTQSLVTRFWNKVDKQSNLDCWNWLGKVSSGDYGQIRVNNRRRQATHVAWYLTYGYWPLQINHKCDNPSCVNSEHLYEGSQTENMQDCVRRGRLNPLFKKGHGYGLHTRFKNGHDLQIGSKHSQAKLTEQQVVDIRYQYRVKNINQTELGRRFGIRQATVSNIITGKLWSHVVTGGKS